MGSEASLWLGVWECLFWKTIFPALAMVVVLTWAGSEKVEFYWALIVCFSFFVVFCFSFFSFSVAVSSWQTFSLTSLDQRLSFEKKSSQCTLIIPQRAIQLILKKCKKNIRAT